MDVQIYFALSRDGRNWTALHDGNPILVSTLGETGVREPDPGILRRTLSSSLLHGRMHAVAEE